MRVGTLACVRCGSADVSALRVTNDGAVCQTCLRPKRTRKQPERAEQAAGVKLLRALGAAVYVLGTTRRAGDYHGTMQTLGICDVIAIFPPKRSWNTTGAALFWECKAKGGKLTPEQTAFREQCLAARLWHVTGDCDALIAALIAEAYLRPDQVPHYRQPQQARDGSALAQIKRCL